MIRRTVGWLASFGLLILILATVFSALASSTMVTPGRLDEISRTTSANDLKPPACAALDLENVIAGDSGSAGNDLILGSATADNITGGDGDDCILGGGGDDSLAGGNGHDVLLGGTGNDFLTGDGGPDDACYGDGGTDSFDGSCETQVE